MIIFSASYHFPDFALCPQNSLIYCSLAMYFDSCIEQIHLCLIQLFQLYNIGDGLWINSAMLHTFLALPFYPWESWRSRFHPKFKNTVINTAVSVFAPLTLFWCHNPSRLFIWGTKKSFQLQPGKLYLTSTLYRLISQKAYDQMTLKCVSS